MWGVGEREEMFGTGELRYLEFQGNGENTSSFPKFEIANYDVHFRLNTLSDRFLNGILARKDISAVRFQLTECKQRKIQWKFKLAHSPIVHYMRYRN